MRPSPPDTGQRPGGSWHQTLLQPGVKDKSFLFLCAKDAETRRGWVSGTPRVGWRESAWTFASLEVAACAIARPSRWLRSTWRTWLGDGPSRDFKDKMQHALSPFRALMLDAASYGLRGVGPSKGSESGFSVTVSSYSKTPSSAESHHRAKFKLGPLRPSFACSSSSMMRFILVERFAASSSRGYRGHPGPTSTALGRLGASGTPASLD